jgi:hypothetical protein
MFEQEKHKITHISAETQVNNANDMFEQEKHGITRVIFSQTLK